MKNSIVQLVLVLALFLGQGTVRAQVIQCSGEVDLQGAIGEIPDIDIGVIPGLDWSVIGFNPIEMILGILPAIPIIGSIPNINLQQILGATTGFGDEFAAFPLLTPDIAIDVPCRELLEPEEIIPNEEEQIPVIMPDVEFGTATTEQLIELGISETLNEFIAEGDYEVPAELPRFNGVPTAELAVEYAEENFNMAFNHFAGVFTQFEEPVKYEFGAIECAPRIGLPFLGCVSTGLCAPFGVAYNVPEDIVDVSYSQTGWFPTEAYEALTEGIKAVEEQADFLLPKIVILLNVAKMRQAIGGDEEGESIVTAAGLAELYIENNDNMTLILEMFRRYQARADQTNMLVFSGEDTPSTVRIPTIWPLGMPLLGNAAGVFESGMSSQLKDIWCFWCPALRTQDHEGRIYGQAPRIGHTGGFEPQNYFLDRAAIANDLPFLAEEAEGEFPAFSEAIYNLTQTLEGAGTAFAQSGLMDEYTEAIEENPVRKTQGLTYSSLPFDYDTHMTEMEQRSRNPFGEDGCRALVMSPWQDGRFSTHETVNAICEFQKTIKRAKYAEQIRRFEPPSCAPDFRTDYCPRDDNDCECELNEMNVPTNEECIYDVVYFNKLDTYYRGPYRNYDEIHRPEELEKLEHLREQTMFTHYHRLRDCPDYEDVQDAIEQIAAVAPALAPLAGIAQLLCGWERCDDEWKYEPAVSRCEATGKHDITSPLEIEIP